MLSKGIYNLIKTLDSQDQKFKDLAFRMMNTGNGIYPVDLLAVGVINRSMSLIFGFTTLIKSNNFIAATHLVRPYLDTYLRFYAVWLVENPHDFAKEVLSGKQVDKLKDRNNVLLKDSHIVEMATKNYSWVKKVYKTSSGFIHLSHKHVFTSTTIAGENSQMAEFKFSRNDKYVPDEAIIEALECMLEITNCIFELLSGWSETKDLKG